MALNKGAQAVIFDVSDDANAAAEVSVSSHSYINDEKKHTDNVTLMFLCLSLPALVCTAARNRLPSSSSGAGGGGGRRGVDGSGQQERGGQSSY